MNQNRLKEPEGEEAFIRQVKTRMTDLLSTAMPGFEMEATSGSMLRGRLVYAMGGPDFGSATAVELMHSGSLLHDDVIDNAVLRRGKPALWNTHGIKGAILFGDLLFFLALNELSDHPRRQKDLIELAGMVCAAACEEELSEAQKSRLEMARRKTGPLFAFAAMRGARDEQSRSALRDAGFLLGTAYQLADDIYDAIGCEQSADKSLRRDKTAPEESTQAIKELYKESSLRLQTWPDLKDAWDDYMERNIRPAIRKFTAGASC